MISVAMVSSQQPRVAMAGRTVQHPPGLAVERLDDRDGGI